MEKEFYETWRKEHGITIEGYQLNRRQLIEMLTDFKHHIEQLHKHVVMGLLVCDHCGKDKPTDLNYCDCYEGVTWVQKQTNCP